MLAFSFSFCSQADNTVSLQNDFQSSLPHGANSEDSSIFSMSYFLATDVTYRNQPVVTLSVDSCLIARQRIGEQSGMRVMEPKVVKSLMCISASSGGRPIIRYTADEAVPSRRESSFLGILQ